MCGPLFYYYPHDSTKRWMRTTPYFVDPPLLQVNTPWTRHTTNGVKDVIMNEGNVGIELYEKFKKGLEVTLTTQGTRWLSLGGLVLCLCTSTGFHFTRFSRNLDLL
jgi:hypothetical protein